MINSERLILRPHRLEDFEAVCALYADLVLLHFIGGSPFTREEVWQRLLRYAGHWALLGYGLFAIVDKATGHMVGETGFADFHRGLGPDFDPFPEAAWIVAQHAQGKGYAQEAASAAHRWLDARPGVAATVCIIHPENRPSLRLAATLGYAARGEKSYRNGTVVMLQRPRPLAFGGLSGQDAS